MATLEICAPTLCWKLQISLSAVFEGGPAM